MTKKIPPLFLSLLFPTLVHAGFPSLHDQVVYVGSDTKLDGEKHSFIQEVSLTQSDGAGHSFYEVRRTNFDNGLELMNDQWVPRAAFFSDSWVSHELEHCLTAGGGGLETITVPAGTFETCHIKEATLDLWVGMVPFAIVRSASTFGGGLLEYSLQSFLQDPPPRSRGLH